MRQGRIEKAASIAESGKSNLQVYHSSLGDVDPKKATKVLRQKVKILTKKPTNGTAPSKINAEDLNGCFAVTSTDLL